MDLVLLEIDLGESRNLEIVSACDTAEVDKSTIKENLGTGLHNRNVLFSLSYLEAEKYDLSICAFVLFGFVESISIKSGDPENIPDSFKDTRFRPPNLTKTNREKPLVKTGIVR